MTSPDIPFAKPGPLEKQPKLGLGSAWRLPILFIGKATSVFSIVNWTGRERDHPRRVGGNGCFSDEVHSSTGKWFQPFKRFPRSFDIQRQVSTYKYRIKKTVMGIRIHVATGFGIQLSPGQVKEMDKDDAREKVESFLIDEIKRDKMFGYYIKARFRQEAIQVGQLYAVPGGWETDTFFGYLSRVRYGDDIDYDVAIYLCKGNMENFEIRLPISFDIDEIEGKFFPMTGSVIWDAARKMKPDDGVFFSSEEECRKLVTLAVKEHGWFSPYYKKGLETVSTIFPGTTMDHIEKYLLGWWN